MMQGKHLAHGMARDKHATNGVNYSCYPLPTGPVNSRMPDHRPFLGAKPLLFRYSLCP